MLFLKRKILALLALSVIITPVPAFAEPTSYDKSTIIAPDCLLTRFRDPYQTLAKTDGFALLNVYDSQLEQLSTEKHRKHPVCGGFFNVSEAWADYNQSHESLDPDLRALTFLKQSITPAQPHAKQTYKIQYQTVVNPLLATIQPKTMWNNLATFSGFKNRYSRAQSGVIAANWIKDQVTTLAKLAGRNDVTVFLVDTGRKYMQPSVVAKLGTSTDPGVVFSAHLDTLNGDMPGADDDGSGSVTVLEGARVIFNSKLKFKKPIYFIWYAAEEMGLVGSQYVVRYVLRNNIPIDNVVHFDMTGYLYKNDRTMWLIGDYVNPDLTKYMASLITTYAKQKVSMTACGYACSDHASWTQGGFTSGMATESAFDNMDPYIHSSKDTMSVLSLDHMTDYAKLGIASVVELAEPTPAN